MSILKTVFFKHHTLLQPNPISGSHLQFKHQFTNASFFSRILQSSTNLKPLQQTHAALLLTGQEHNTIFATRLVNSYAENGRLKDASLVFGRIENHHIFLWNSIITWHWRYGRNEQALQFYHQMLKSNQTPDSTTFNCVLRACVDLGSPQNAIQIYNHARECGFQIDAAVGTELVKFFCRFGSVELAQKVFDEIPERNVVHWTVMITGFVTNGYHREALELFSRMRVSGVAPNSFTVVSVLADSAILRDSKLGSTMHGYVVRVGLESYLFVGTALLDMYAKCGDIQYAYKLFEKMHEPNMVYWNAMISGFVYNGFFKEALLLFNKFRFSDLRPDSVTMLGVIRGCINLEFVGLCECIHGYIIRMGLDLCIPVINSILDMYSSLGYTQRTGEIFDRMPMKDVISWTILIGGLVKIEQAYKALQLFCRMRDAGFHPDMVIMVHLLTACSLLRDLQIGRLIHNQIVVCGFCSELPIANSLISMYSKCGDFISARITFDRMSEKSLVSWSAMISGYVQNGQARDALGLVTSLRMEDFDLDSTSLVSSISACAELACLELCKQLHAYTITAGFLSSNTLQNSLTAAYAKCGDLGLAVKVFEKIGCRDTVSWNAIISGCGINGNASAALALFHDMEKSDAALDEVTYLSILNACSHAGMVDDGKSIFRSMIQKGKVRPSKEHYACVVDMLARAGHLDEANEFIRATSGEPGLNVWKALLGGCRIHNEVQLADFAAKHLFSLDPKEPDHVVLLSNVYSAAGKFEEAASLRLKMDMKGLIKKPGLSLIKAGASSFG